MHERPIGVTRPRVSGFSSSVTTRPRSSRSRSAGATRERYQRGRNDHESLGHRQRPQQPAGFAAEREHRDERERGDHQRGQDRRRERAGRGDDRQRADRLDDAPPGFEPPVTGLERDELGIDGHAERDRDSAEAHDGGGNAP